MYFTDLSLTVSPVSRATLANPSLSPQSTEYSESNKASRAPPTATPMISPFSRRSTQNPFPAAVSFRSFSSRSKPGMLARNLSTTLWTILPSLR